MLADPRSKALVDELRRPVAVPAQRPRRDARLAAVPRLRREPAAGVPAGDGAVLRDDRARGSQRARPAGGTYTFVNERLARHYGIPNVYGSHFRRVELTDERSARRPARTGQHPDGDVVSEPDVAGAARQVDSREHPRRAAAAAAAERAATRGEECRRQGAVDARADGAASRQPGVRQLPLADGSARASRSRTSTRSAGGATASESNGRSTPPGALPDGTPFDGPRTARALLVRPGAVRDAR